MNILQIHERHRTWRKLNFNCGYRFHQISGRAWQPEIRKPGFRLYLLLATVPVNCHQFPARPGCLACWHLAKGWRIACQGLLYENASGVHASLEAFRWLSMVINLTRVINGDFLDFSCLMPFCHCAETSFDQPVTCWLAEARSIWEPTPATNLYITYHISANYQQLKTYLVSKQNSKIHASPWCWMEPQWQITWWPTQLGRRHQQPGKWRRRIVFGKGTFLSQKILEVNKLELTEVLFGLFATQKVEFKTLLCLWLFEYHTLTYLFLQKKGVLSQVSDAIVFVRWNIRGTVLSAGGMRVCVVWIWLLFQCLSIPPNMYINIFYIHIYYVYVYIWLWKQKHVL